MKLLDAKSIGDLPGATQVLLLDYMRLLDHSRHAFIFGVLMPTVCLLLCCASTAIEDRNLTCAICALFLSLIIFMVAEGEPWKLFKLRIDIKRIRRDFAEVFHMDIRRLSSNDIWIGTTLSIDPKEFSAQCYSNDSFGLMTGLFVSVLIFSIELWAPLFLKNPSFWMLV